MMRAPSALTDDEIAAIHKGWSLWFGNEGWIDERGHLDRLIADLNRARGALREIIVYCEKHEMLEGLDLQKGIYIDHGEKVLPIAKKGLGK